MPVIDNPGWFIVLFALTSYVDKISNSLEKQLNEDGDQYAHVYVTRHTDTRMNC